MHDIIRRWAVGKVRYERTNKLINDLWTDFAPSTKECIYNFLFRDEIKSVTYHTDRSHEDHDIESLPCEFQK